MNYFKFSILAIIYYSFAFVRPEASVIPHILQALELDPVTTNTDSIIRTVHRIENLEFPYAQNPDDIISHTGFSFLFNDAHKQSDWTVYMLCRERLANPVAKRKDNFRPDPAVKTGTATLADYKGSKHDRGHLVPCADMLWSQTAMDESFFFSNMSPHLATFHQAGGIWYKLEDLVNIWALEYDTLYIVSGPALQHGTRGTIGKNKVSIPEYFYKVILNYTQDRIEGIGFIMPHEKIKSGNPVSNYAVSIDSVQNFTGINFFHNLPDPQEQYIESRLCKDCWIWQKPKSKKTIYSH
jgi:endonuclease G